MKRPRFRFGLRFFLVAVVFCAFAVIFIWEKANQIPVFRSDFLFINDVTYGHVGSLDELTLSPAEAMKAMKIDRAFNVKMQKQVSFDAEWECVEIQPMKTVIERAHNYPLIGFALRRKRDFRCTLKGVDCNGEQRDAVLIFNRSHLHVVETD